MESKEITKNIIKLNKAIFDGAYITMETVQDQTEKMGKILLQNIPWVPEQGKQISAEYNQIVKKSYSRFKKIVDDQFASSL